MALSLSGVTLVESWPESWSSLDEPAGAPVVILEDVFGEDKSAWSRDGYRFARPSIIE